MGAYYFMDFISGLSKTRRGNGVIWVIVDRLMKSAHFLPMKIGSQMRMHQLTKLFIAENVSLHGDLVLIVSDRESRFVSRFWTTLHEAMGT